MIPNIQPAPSWQPQGWSPNALAPVTSTLAVDIQAAFEAMRLALVPGFLYLAAYDVSAAEIDNLFATPVIVLPAPGPQLAIFPLYVTINWANSVAFATQGNLFLRYTNNSGVIIHGAQGVAAINANRRTVLTFPTTSAAFRILSPATPPVNDSLQLQATADFSGGTLLACRVVITYALLSVPTSF